MVKSLFSSPAAFPDHPSVHPHVVWPNLEGGVVKFGKQASVTGFQQRMVGLTWSTNGAGACTGACISPMHSFGGLQPPRPCTIHPPS